EAEMRKKDKELTNRADNVREQLRDEGDRLNKKNGQSKDGPAKELQDALRKGDMKKMQDEADRLAKKLQEDKLSPEDQELLRQQLDDLKQDLQQLSRQKDEEKLLRDLADKGEINKETLDRELEKLKDDGEPQKDFKEIEQ